jgi:hypothetical protein
VKLQFDNLQGFTSSGNQGRNKRPASDAFEKDQLSEVLPKETIGPPIQESKVTTGFGDHVGVQDLSNQLMAHILGLDVNPVGIVDSTNPFWDSAAVGRVRGWLVAIGYVVPGDGSEFRRLRFAANQRRRFPLRCPTPTRRARPAQFVL